LKNFIKNKKMQKETIQNEHLIIQRYIDVLIHSDKDLFLYTTFSDPETAKKTIFYAAWQFVKDKHDTAEIEITPKDAYQSYTYDLRKIKFTGKSPIVTELKFKDWCRKHRGTINNILEILSIFF